MEQNIRNTIAGTITDFHMPRFEDIPNVGLYLEQTVSYITEYLSPILDSAITSSMISNYVKKKLVSNPVRKQYSRDQIASLFFIAVTKSVLSLENIRVLLAIRDERYDSSTAYNYFCDGLERVISSVFRLEQQEEQGRDEMSGRKDVRGRKETPDRKEPESGKKLQDASADETDARSAEEKDILHNTVTAVVHKIYLDKWIGQYSRS